MLEEAAVFHVEYQNYRGLLQKLSDRFCEVNIDDPTQGDELLDLHIQFYNVSKRSSEFFFLRRSRCLNDGQRLRIVSYLNTVLEVTSPHFHRLVSTYNLKVYQNFLVSHVNVEELWGRIEEYKYSKRLSGSTIFQLKNMATLANLDYHDYEDILLEMVDSMYHIARIAAVDEMGVLNEFFVKIVPNTVALLGSKSSVIKTLYLFDETTIGYFGHDVIPVNYAQYYFTVVVRPKLKDGYLIATAEVDFQANKQMIKDKILSDNSIWFEDVSIEN